MINRTPEQELFIERHNSQRKQSLRVTEEKGIKTFWIDSFYKSINPITKEVLIVPIHTPINESQFKERQRYNGGVLEIENDNNEYTPKQKPTSNALKQLKFIKQIRTQQAQEESLIINHKLHNSVLNLIGLRATNRLNAMLNLADDFILMLKERKQEALSYEDIKDLFRNLQVSEITKKRLISDFIKVLSGKGFKKEKYKKTHYTFEITELLSFVKTKNLKIVDCIANGNKSIYKMPHSRNNIRFIFN